MLGGPDHPKVPKLEYDYIADGIYIGTNQCCQAHFDEELKAKGVTADVSLEGEKVDTPFGVEFYVWLPVKDHTPPTLDQLKFGVVVLEKLVYLGRKIYVHCKHGHGRAPTLVTAYFIKKGKTLEEAEAFVKSKRSSIHIEDSQRKALERFAKGK